MIMNFSTPPSLEEIEAIAQAHLDNIPDELKEFCENLSMEVEEMPDEVLESDLDLDSAFEIFAHYKNGSEISPGIESKLCEEDDKLILFRRPILDYWCETYDDLSQIIRQVIISEIGQQFDFEDDEIEDMTDRHFDYDIDCAEYA